MVWPLSLDTGLDHARRERDSRCDVVNVLSQMIWHMVVITTDLDAVALSTFAFVLEVLSLEHLLGLGGRHVQSKPALVFVVHDAGGVDSGAGEPGLDIFDSLQNVSRLALGKVGVAYFFGRCKEVVHFFSIPVLPISAGCGMTDLHEQVVSIVEVALRQANLERQDGIGMHAHTSLPTSRCSVTLLV